MFRNLVLKKGTVIAVLTALTLTMLSVSSVFAAGPTNTPTTAASTQASAQSLEASWKFELARFQFDSAILARVDRMLDGIRSRSLKIEVRSERNEKGEKSTTFTDASALLSKAQAIITSHADFDGTGKVTDQTQAAKAMDQLGALLNQFHVDLLYKLRNLLHA